MSHLTQDNIKVVIDQILDAMTELDAFFTGDPRRPNVGPPARETDLQALEQHWERSLPPSYRLTLSVYNGVSCIWARIPLLSTQEIIEDRHDTTTFEEPFPNLWKFIFACGTESYDALTFDGSTAQPNGEMEVVELSEEGEGQRWPTFYAFLTGLLTKILQELASEKADREGLPT